MRNQIDCFVAIASAGDAEATIETLSRSVSVRDITLMIEPQTAQAYPQAQVIETESLTSTATLAEIARRATAPYVLLTLKAQPILWGDHAIERMVETAADTGAGMIYADSRMATADGKLVAHPAIDYQKGALRDDFDFGPAVLVSTALLKGYMAQPPPTTDGLRGTTCASTSRAKPPSPTSTSISTPSSRPTAAPAVCASLTM